MILRIISLLLLVIGQIGLTGMQSVFGQRQFAIDGRFQPHPWGLDPVIPNCLTDESKGSMFSGWAYPATTELHFPVLAICPFHFAIGNQWVASHR